jgi:hypothetical protein
MSPCDGSLVPFFQLSEAFSRNLPCVSSAGTENPKQKATAYVRSCEQICIRRDLSPLMSLYAGPENTYSRYLAKPSQLL